MQFETSGDSFWSLKRYLQVEHKAIVANGKLIVFWNSMDRKLFSYFWSLIMPILGGGSNQKNNWKKFHK